MSGKTPQVGQRVPDFELVDSAGAIQRLSVLNTAGPLVLIFYRGYW
jgi:peroxiredoxin